MSAGRPQDRIFPSNAEIQPGFCGCGCGQELVWKDKRFNRGHKIRPSLYERLFEKTQMSTGCWIWIANKNECGYGTIRFNWRCELAHRMMWFIYSGIWPAGVCILHSCDNPSCVNPYHLRPGSHQENIKEAADKNHYKWGIYRKPQSRWKGEQWQRQLSQSS